MLWFGLVSGGFTVLGMSEVPVRVGRWSVHSWLLLLLWHTAVSCQQTNSKHPPDPLIARQQHSVYVPHIACHFNGIMHYKVSIYINYYVDLCPFWGTRWRSWLRHCATSRKVAGSIPDGVTEIFHWHNPSGRTMVLGSTQPLTEVSTRNISWG